MLGVFLAIEGQDLNTQQFFSKGEMLVPAGTIDWEAIRISWRSQAQRHIKAHQGSVHPGTCLPLLIKAST